MHPKVSGIVTANAIMQPQTKVAPESTGTSMGNETLEGEVRDKMFEEFPAVRKELSAKEQLKAAPENSSTSAAAEATLHSDTRCQRPQTGCRRGKAQGGIEFLQLREPTYTPTMRSSVARVATASARRFNVANIAA